MEKKIVAPRIREEAKNWYGQTFPTTNAGVVFVLEAFPDIYRRTLMEIKGRFSAEELYLLLDIHNAYAMTPGMVGLGVELQAADSISLDASDKKWKIEKSSFLKKLNAFTSFQAAALEIWATSFWQSSEDHWGKKDSLKKYAEILI